MLRRSLLALSLLASFAAASHAAATVGQPAPDFSLADTAGQPVKLSDFRGKYVVLEWTNPGCPYVRKHYDSGNMPATQKDARAKGAVWLAINSTAKSAYDYLEPPRLAAWLNAIVTQMAVRRMLFGRYEVELEGGRLTATAIGEPISPERHQPAVEVKGATYTLLRVAHTDDGGWLAQTVVDV